MKIKIIPLIVILLTAVSFGFGQGKNKANSNDQVLMDMEKAAWNNLVAKNYDAFARMFADDYQGVYDAETTTKATELAEVRQMTFKSADVPV